MNATTMSVENVLKMQSIQNDYAYLRGIIRGGGLIRMPALLQFGSDLFREFAIEYEKYINNDEVDGASIQEVMDRLSSFLDLYDLETKTFRCFVQPPKISQVGPKSEKFDQAKADLINKWFDRTH